MRRLNLVIYRSKEPRVCTSFSKICVLSLKHQLLSYQTRRLVAGIVALHSHTRLNVTSDESHLVPHLFLSLHLPTNFLHFQYVYETFLYLT
jgi:hypothetical protein